jgi:Putative Actinobacterial Holin-X, holin superfamily III
MPNPDRPLLADVKDEVAALAADVQELLALRFELARRELAADARTVRRLAVAAVMAAMMFLTALPLVAVASAWYLEGRCGISLGGWLLIHAAVLVVVAGAVGYFTWRRFRRDFIGLAETLEECREDMRWLREWLAKK